MKKRQKQKQMKKIPKPQEIFSVLICIPTMPMMKNMIYGLLPNIQSILSMNKYSTYYFLTYVKHMSFLKTVHCYTFQKSLNLSP